MPLPVKNTPYSFNFRLISMNGGFQSNPTLAAGDIKIIVDDGAANNIDSLPSLLTNSTTTLNMDLLATEMNGDIITIELIDQTDPKEWCDTFITIHTIVNSLDDVNIADGIIEANIKKIHDNSNAALILEKMMRTPISGSVSADAGNTDTQFKTNLTEADDYYGDSTGGMLLAFTSGNLAGQSKRVTGFVNSTGFITVESAFLDIPDTGSGFILVGRIEV